MASIDLNSFPQWNEKFLCGMLSAADEELFLRFLEEHPELMDEAMLEGPTMEAPEVSFSDKQMLKKEESPIGEVPMFDYLTIKQMEEGLTLSENQRFDELLDANPQLARHAALYAKTKLKADNAVVFANKASLKRVLFWQSTLGRALKYSSAAAVLAGMVWFSWPSDSSVRNQFASVVRNPVDTTKTTVIEQPKKVVSDTEPANDTILRSKESHPLKAVPAPKKASEAEMVDPYLEPAERQLAKLSSKGSHESLDPTTLNGYEKGLEVMMPLYLDNQIEIGKLMALLEEEQKAQVEPEKEGLMVKMVEGGVKLLNAAGRKDLKFDKYYDADGNFVAYKVKGDGLELSRKVK